MRAINNVPSKVTMVCITPSSMIMMENRSTNIVVITIGNKVTLIWLKIVISSFKIENKMSVRTVIVSKIESLGTASK